MLKLVGVVKEYFKVFKIDNEFVVIFVYDDIKIALDKFHYCDWASYETLCFKANIVFDTKVVGTCSNDGNGGSTDIHFNKKHIDLVSNVVEQITKLPHLLLPNSQMCITNIIDTIAAINSSIQDVSKDIETIKDVIDIINDEYNNAKEMFKEFTK